LSADANDKESGWSADEASPSYRLPSRLDPSELPKLVVSVLTRVSLAERSALPFDGNDDESKVSLNRSASFIADGLSHALIKRWVDGAHALVHCLSALAL